LSAGITIIAGRAVRVISGLAHPGIGVTRGGLASTGVRTCHCGTRLAHTTLTCLHIGTCVSVVARHTI
jgi:hypothetical protein